MNDVTELFELCKGTSISSESEDLIRRYQALSSFNGKPQATISWKVRYPKMDVLLSE